MTPAFRRSNPILAALVVLLLSADLLAWGGWGGRGSGRSKFRWSVPKTHVKGDRSRTPRYKPQPGFVTQPTAVINPHAPPLAGRPLSEARLAPVPTQGEASGGDAPTGRFPEADDRKIPAIQPPPEHAEWHDGYWRGWWEAGPAWRWRVAPWFHLAGYSPYRNPYDESGKLGRPVGRGGEMTKDARRHFEAARISFRGGKYDRALLQVEASVGASPDDGALHEFRALVLFALARYGEAAAEVHAVLATTPGWSQDTRSGLYRDPGAYMLQLSALEKEALGDPKNESLAFLLAYHRLVASDLDAAAAPLGTAASAAADDPVLADLRRSVTDPEAPLAEAPPVPYELEGGWRAQSPGGGSIDLGFAPDGTFTWTWLPDQGKGRSFTGSFELVDGMLTLRENDGGPTETLVLPHGNGSFELKAASSPADLPGLRFERKPSR